MTPIGPGTIRVATWNVERVKPRGWKKAPAQLRRMAEVAADIWVLTETDMRHSPGAGFNGVFSPAYPSRRPEHERWAAIWSHWPIQLLDDPAPHPRGTLAARIDSPAGALIVYGAVIPWAHEPLRDDGQRAKLWELHEAAIERISGELDALRRSHPDMPLILAGDFNQLRDGTRGYGKKSARESLTQALDRNGLTCLTDEDMVACGRLSSNHLIDHICVSSNLRQSGPVLCWEPRDSGNVRLSDHPVVAVDLQVKPQ